ncbi:hypothetical protein CYMTET_32871 [Cymbomonas tetramitiformis]|uniref:AAA+ ATPase domain-containing protein n=1 Tax=Cymbomonas tetramitiformis TaxID=36881 RepID=A0AAE0FE44_9CHLO|nr:hypothetical protein CYMTET_32871 [Cymbomonas tetramitiformis]
MELRGELYTRVMQEAGTADVAAIDGSADTATRDAGCLGAAAVYVAESTLQNLPRELQVGSIVEMATTGTSAVEDTEEPEEGADRPLRSQSAPGSAVVRLLGSEHVEEGHAALSRLLCWQLGAAPHTRVRLSRAALEAPPKAVTLHPVRLNAAGSGDKAGAALDLTQQSLDRLLGSLVGAAAAQAPDAEEVGLPIMDGMFLQFASTAPFVAPSESAAPLQVFQMTWDGAEELAADASVCPAAILRPQMLQAGPRALSVSWAKQPVAISTRPCKTGAGKWEAPRGGLLADLGWLEDPAALALERALLHTHPVQRGLLATLGTPPPGHTLLHGPSGCGKSVLALAIARSLRENASVLVYPVLVPCRKLMHAPAAKVKAALRSVLTEAMASLPSLVILDDLHTLCPAESEGPEGGHGSASSRAISAYLGDLMDTALQVGQPAISFVATAESVESLASVLCRPGRFEHELQLQPPDQDHRATIVVKAAAARGVRVPQSVAIAAARLADGFDALDMAILMERTLHCASGRYIAATNQDKAASRGKSIAAPCAADGPQGDGRALSGPRHELGHEGVGFNLVEADFQEARRGLVPAAFQGVGGASAQSGEGPKKSNGAQGWASVGGLEEAQRVMREVLELPVKHPELFSAAPLRQRSGMMLFGPPGCGKTHIVAAAAAASGLRFIGVKGPELLNKYIGQSEASVRDVFRRATASKPCLLFFDEFDAIAPKRGHDNTGVTDRVVNQLLTELDGVEGLAGVAVVAATSRPDLIDLALLRPGRLDRMVHCDFPSRRERLEVLEVLATGMTIEDESVLHLVADATEGFSPADLQALLGDAQLAAVHALVDDPDLPADTAGTPVMTRNMVVAALEAARPSVSISERERLQLIYDQFTASRSPAGDAASSLSREKSKGKRATLA